MKKYSLRTGLLLLCGGGVVVIWSVLVNPQLFPIKDIKVVAVYNHIQPQQLQQVIAPFASKSFFELSVSKLQEQLQQIPWVERATISRIWPNSIAIKIVEQQPVAIWDGESLLNAKGELFTPKTLVDAPKQLPRLFGPVGFQHEMWQYYLEIVAKLQVVGLTLQQLTVNSRHGWQLQLADGMALYLGNTKIMNRLERFLKVYTQVIKGHEDKIADVDLRYNSGFAVQWRR